VTYFLGDFSFARIFLKNYRVTMTTTSDTSCSANTMVLSARRGFLHACIFWLFKLMTSELMSTLNMDGHGDKTDSKGGENKRNMHKARTDR
jgi:hypothetical protein